MNTAVIVELPEDSGRTWLTNADATVYVPRASTFLGMFWVDVTGNAPVGSALVLMEDSPIKGDSKGNAITAVLKESLLNKHPVAEYAGFDPSPTHITSIRIGVPFEAFCAKLVRWKDQNGTNQFQQEGGIHVSGRFLPGIHNQSSRFIPLRPVWSGFLIDLALVYAALYVIQWVIVFLFQWVTRRKRVQKQRKRDGACLECGYPLGDLKRCPECGADSNFTDC